MVGHGAILFGFGNLKDESDLPPIRKLDFTEITLFNNIIMLSPHLPNACFLPSQIVTSTRLTSPNLIRNGV